jgi:hypothetical protein
MADPVPGGVARVESPKWYANRSCANWFPGPTPAMRADLEAMAREILRDAAALCRSRQAHYGTTRPASADAWYAAGECAALIERAAGGEGE